MAHHGRPGVVLISEGPASQRPAADRRVQAHHHIMRNVPVHQIQVAATRGRFLKDLQSAAWLKNVLTAEEVPQASARINALRSGEPPIPRASIR